MNAANNPRANPDEAAAVRQWAERNSCDFCGNTDWTSLLRWRWFVALRELQDLGL